MKKAKTNADRIEQLEAEVAALQGSVDMWRETAGVGTPNVLNNIISKLKEKIESRGRGKAMAARKAMHNLLKNIRNTREGGDTDQ